MTTKDTAPDTGADTGTNAASKTQQVIEAARRRNQNARQVDAEKAEGDQSRKDANEERVRELAENKQQLADVNVQARAKTLAGEIDPLAMGDVKGDGRDAKDYDDNDPDKALGITVAEHGLGTTTDGADGEIATAFGHRLSSRTQKEMQRGKENLEDAKTERRRFNKGSTAVTDASDTDGSKGDEAAAEKKSKNDK